jgi:hypothetical protein
MVFALTALFFIIKNLLNNQWVLAIDEKALHIRIQKYYLIPWARNNRLSRIRDQRE